MSDNFTILIPGSPGYVPSKEAQAQAVALMKEFAPNADEVKVETTEEIRFIDCGANFERVDCPDCGAEIAMDYGWAEHHKDWYQLGSEFVVDEAEFDEAFSFLNDPIVAGALEALLDEVTEEFIERHLPANLFEDFSCSFYVQQEPEKRG